MDTLEAQGESGRVQPIPAGMRYEHGKVVPHLTVEERVARGKAARGEVPRSSHAGFTPGAHPARPGGAAGAAGRDPGAGAGADPLRPDAGVAVHLLPGRGAHHGRRPGRHTRARGSPRRCAATPT